MSEWINGRPDTLKTGMVIETPDAKGAYLVGDICNTVCTLDKISRYKLNNFLPDEHNCGVADDRESSILMHQILAEIRKSNAPSWVAEELQKKFDCQRCWLAFRRHFEALYHTRLSYQGVLIGSERSKTNP
ncbi:MAG: hypothetical protein MUO26_16185 [Methanotrichaceae archaeon]|nr:hypothetical protein [Methanotrichaceae archaeon]